MESIQKKIFIGGTGRCGTTWLGSWLRQHPDIFGGPETHIFEICNNFFNPSWNQGLKTWMSRDSLVEYIRHFILECLSNSRYRRHKQPHVVEYSYNNYANIDFIQELFKDAYFIHIYRDGRNVVESWLRVLGFEHPIEHHINGWMCTMEDMLSNDRPNVMNIKYETLMENPELSREITKFIEIKHHRDIDSWEFPVNTPNFSYDYDRWQKNLSKDNQEKLMVMNELLERLEYFPRLPRMDKKELERQLHKIEHLLSDTDWLIGGSASQVLLGLQADCKDIDVIQLNGEPICLDKPYKQNHFSRMYRDYRLDIHYVGSSEEGKNYCQGNAYRLLPAMAYINKNYTEQVGKWKVCSERGFHLVHWLLHYFVWQPEDVLQNCRKIALPNERELQTFRQILGDNIVNGICGRVQVAMNNNEARKKNLYYQSEIPLEPVL